MVRQTRLFRGLPVLLILLWVPQMAAQIPTAYAKAVSAPDKALEAAGQMYLESMYVPSVTRGPWAPSWSPNGKEIAISMHGSIWKVSADGGEAEQITSGPEYDYQPQWSPDGRLIAFSRDNGNRIEIWVVNPDGSSPRQLTRGNAISVDPEWHSSTLLYFSSNMGGKALGLWQVGLDGGEPKPLLVDGKQSCEPSSSPDGKAVVFISSREIVPGYPASYGSGDFWKMNLADGSLHLLSRQETLWHARPRWSRDGKKIVYVSLQTGRNQLFVMDAQTGIPVQLAYMDAEPFTPAWSPDSKRILFISNADHEFTLWTMPAAGGEAKRLNITRLKWREPVGRLQVRIEDESGRPTAARVYLQGGDGKAWAPKGAFERVSVITGDHYFSSEGVFELELPAGAATIEAMKGFQYRPQKNQVEIAAGRTHSVTLKLERIADLQGQGSYGGDNHLHMNYGGVFGQTPDSLLREADAEDLDVVNDLATNHNTHLIDLQHFTGKPNPRSSSSRILYFNEEFRPNFAGHMGLLNLKQFFFPVYNGYGGTPYAADYPSNAQMLDSIHAQGAIGGYVHPYLMDRGQDFLEGNFIGAREFPADVALGKVDYYDLMCIWTDKYAAGDVLYRLWNLGFRIPISVGTDVMPDYWRAPSLGSEKVYVHTSSPLTYENWIQDFKRGRSFVTNGPLLRTSIGGKEPGEEIRLEGAGGEIPVEVEAVSIFPMTRLDVLQDGKVVRSYQPEDAYHARVREVLRVSRSGWIAVRVSGPEKLHLLTDSYVYAHTNPVWLNFSGQPQTAPEDAAYFVKWMDLALQQLPERLFDSRKQRDEVTDIYVKARDVFRRLEAFQPRSSLKK